MIVTLLEVVIAILVIFSASLLYFHYKLVKDKAKDEYIINTTRNVSRKMYELGSEEDFIRSICETVQNITHSDEFSYFKYVPEEALLVPQYVVGPYKDQISRVKIKIGEGFTGHVAKEKKAMFLNDAEKSSIGKHIPGTPNENTSLLAIPIIFSSNLLGVALQTKLGGFHFNKEELNLSEIFVNLAAVFIAGENYAQSVSKLIEDKAKDEYIINTTRNVSRKMYELGSEEDFIRSICETVQNITHSDEFSYFKYVPEEALLVPQYVVGPYKDQISRVKIKIGEGFTGHVAKEKKAMFLNDAEKSSIGKHIPGTPNENTSLLAIPIIFSSNLLGVALQTKLGGAHFDKEELNLSEIFVNLTAGFIAGENYVHSIRQGFVDMLKVLITTVELKDTYTAGHSIRVSKISEIIGKEMGLSQKEIAIAKIGGLLHDIGKIGVQEAILRKNSNLKAKEIDEIKTHPTLGSELISKFKIFTGVPEAILYHHEWYNGNGYPKGLKGEQIPILSRIIAVSDAIDAMATGRPGRTTKTAEEAFIELEKWSNTQFDSRVVKAALKKKDEIEEALEEGLNIERFATEEDFERISS